MKQSSNSPSSLQMEGKVIYILGLVALVQTIYPITVAADGRSSIPIMLIVYQLIYASLMVAGILLVRESPFYLRLLIILGILWTITGVVYTLNQTALWALVAGYVVIGAFQAAVVWVLMRYMFTAREVNRDIIYAACAVYLLLGAIFTPIYGLIETLTFFGSGGLDGGMHAFSDGVVAAGEILPWQTFVYYSYATLTTLGYGDILPVTFWARSAASIEAIIGVLYITIVMARLVGLYAYERVEGAEEEAPAAPFDKT
ncbi:MAG: potassium channel family protein [Ardenticatenaceae bacterium]|nr:potassium channel family protein [Ardenticatenaceae bacterium]